MSRPRNPSATVTKKLSLLATRGCNGVAVGSSRGAGRSLVLRGRGTKQAARKELPPRVVRPAGSERPGLQPGVWPAERRGGYYTGPALAILLLLVSGLSAAWSAELEIVRDRWGTPHVLAQSDQDAFYGLGYATAEDRGFQMYYNLRVIQGRLAELLGDVQKMRRRESAVQSDRKMRTFGFYRAAGQVAERLDPETRRLLQAYCDGVNDYFRRHRADRHYLFERLGLEPEPWTPADCIAVWWRMAQFFGPDGTRDLLAQRGRRRRAAEPRRADDSAAVVRREDVSREWVERVNAFLRQHGLLGRSVDPLTDPTGPRFSHAWVVGGRKTTTGAAVLVSDPQTLVGNPSMFYEFHIRGRTFNVRGIGVPGSPVILIGFNQRVAWGMTALGADQADLFRLKTDSAHPDQYFFDGQWRRMELVKETIRVKGGEPQELTVRWTHLGPVVTDYVFARPEDGQFALKRVPVCVGDSETVQAAVQMMRARDAFQFARALAGWQFPSANVVFGDSQGNIGYWVLGALPVRSSRSSGVGRFPQDGTRSDGDWQGFLPHDLKPHVLNPKRGYIYSANHRPVGSFYKAYIGATTGFLGHTLRSFRLDELLSSEPLLAPEDVLAVHYSDVNPARRDLVRAGLFLRDRQKAPLSDDARKALEHLEPWLKAGARSDLNVPGAALAMQINTMFRVVNTELAAEYGGGETGLTRFLKSLQQRLAHPRTARLTDKEARYIDAVLARAWQSAVAKYGPDTERWNDKARQQVTHRRLGYFVSLDGFPSLDPAQDLPQPPLACVDGATIRSQAAQSYTQFVRLDDVDRSLSLLPIGASERPGSPFRTSTLKLWATGRLHPAPLSEKAVRSLAVSTTKLERGERGHEERR